MTSEEALLAVIDALKSVGIPYMLVGGASVSYYGIGRSTRDADFVVELGGGCHHEPDASAGAAVSV